MLEEWRRAYGVVLEEEQTNADRPEAIITPRSDVQRCQMEAWRRMWRILGASEAQILELIGFLVEVTVPGWKSVCVVTEGLDQPACLETVWRSSKLRESQGKIRVVSSVNPLDETQRNALVYLEDIWSVAGKRAFDTCRSNTDILGPRGLHRVLLMPNNPTPSHTVLLGLPFADKLHKWQEQQQLGDDVESTLRMNSQVPKWIQAPSIQTRWKPCVEGGGTEENSSICIRFQQRAKDRILRPEAQVCPKGEIMNSLLATVNEIQMRCGTYTNPFHREDIDFQGFKNQENNWTGMISLRFRSRDLLSIDVLTGCLLAFLIGNEIELGPSQYLKWCPLQGKLGFSSCGITRITSRRSCQANNRHEILLGQQVKGVATWVINDKNKNNRTLIAIVKVLKSGKGVSEALSRLGRDPWHIQKMNARLKISSQKKVSPKPSEKDENSWSELDSVMEDVFKEDEGEE